LTPIDVRRTFGEAAGITFLIPVALVLGWQALRDGAAGARGWVLAATLLLLIPHAWACWRPMWLNTAPMWLRDFAAVAMCGVAYLGLRWTVPAV
jgi:hypothetical protein